MEWTKPLNEITREDMIEVQEPRLPKTAFRGWVRDAKGAHMGNVYVVKGRAIVARPREFGTGEISHRLPGDFDPKAFRSLGSEYWTSSRRVKVWGFK